MPFFPSCQLTFNGAEQCTEWVPPSPVVYITCLLLGDIRFISYCMLLQWVASSNTENI